MSQRPQRRTFTQRAWNAMRSPMQRQSTKDYKLIESVKAGDYNGVLKYLNRGARVSLETIGKYTEDGGLEGRLLYNSNRTDEQNENDLEIFKLLTRDRNKVSEHYAYIITRLNFVEYIINMRKELKTRIETGNVDARDEFERLRDRTYIENLYTQIVREAREARVAAVAAEADAQLAAAREARRVERERQLEEERQRDEEQALLRAQQYAAWRARLAAARAAAEAAERAAEVRVAEERARRDVYEQRNVAYHVHRETAKFSGKVPEILEVIKRDLGNPIEENYEDIEAVFDRTLGTYIKESPGFESKAINSIQVNNPNGTKGPKILSRAEWIQDLERVKEGVKGANLVKKVQMGMIFEFIIKHEELTECFIAGFVHDCTHAYANGHLSCFAGIIERTISTLINCIKGMDEGVFGELNEIIENNIESWSELDKAKQAAYIMKWNEFLLRWSQANSENEVIKGMTAAERSNAAMSDFKREERVPRYVEEHIQAELFPLLTDGIWSDYGFNASTSVGGKRRKTRRNRKTRKHRKTTRHRKTRIHRKKTTRRR